MRGKINIVETHPKNALYSTSKLLHNFKVYLFTCRNLAKSLLSSPYMELIAESGTTISTVIVFAVIADLLPLLVHTKKECHDNISFATNLYFYKHKSQQHG